EDGHGCTGDGVDGIPVVGSRTDGDPVGGRTGGGELYLDGVGSKEGGLEGYRIRPQGHHGQRVAVDQGIAGEVIHVDIEGVNGAVAIAIAAETVPDAMLPIGIAAAVAVGITIFMGLGKAKCSIAFSGKSLVVPPPADAIVVLHELDIRRYGDEVAKLLLIFQFDIPGPLFIRRVEVSQRVNPQVGAVDGPVKRTTGCGGGMAAEDPA